MGTLIEGDHTFIYKVGAVGGTLDDSASMSFTVCGDSVVVSKDPTYSLDFTYPKTTLGSNGFSTITIDASKFSTDNSKCYFIEFKLSDTTSPPVSPAMEFNSACTSPQAIPPPTACKEIKVYTDRARTGTGEVLNYRLVVVAFGQG